MHACPLVPGSTSAADSSISDVPSRYSCSNVGCLASGDLAVSSVEVFVRPKSTDTASAVYMTVDSATGVVADNTAAAVSVAGFRR